MGKIHVQFWLPNRFEGKLCEVFFTKILHNFEPGKIQVNRFEGKLSDFFLNFSSFFLFYNIQNKKKPLFRISWNSGAILIIDEQMRRKIVRTFLLQKYKIKKKFTNSNLVIFRCNWWINSKKNCAKFFSILKFFIARATFIDKLVRGKIVRTFFFFTKIEITKFPQF